MPSPTPQSVTDVLEHLKDACTRGMREPTADLSAEEHAILLELHVHDPMAAGVVLQHLREHARTLEGWRRGEVRALNFRIYIEGARRRIQEEQAIESAANVVRLTTQRQARLRRARTHDVTGDSLAGLTVEQMLETDAPLLVAFALLKQHRDGRIWYDDFHKRTMTDWNGDESGTVIEPQIVVDEQVGRVQRWLQARDKRLNRLSLQAVNQILDNVAYEDKRNAPRDWIEGIQWDGIARLGDVMRVGFGAADTPFNHEAGRCWFVSMVARVFKPGCKVDTMPVFIGPQGALKSQALETIGGAWYKAAASSIDAKDFLQELHGALVFEVQELHSILSSRIGAARAKAVLSTRMDNFRLPYGLRVEEHKRTCVICGTTNNRDWHSDETGGRRYWPIHCERIDLPWLRRNRAQLFAEALAYWRGRNDAIAAGIAEETARDPDFDPLDFVEPDGEEFRLGQWWNVPSAEQVELMDAETFESPWQAMIESRLAAELARGTIWRGQHGTANVGIEPWDGTANETTQWGNLLTVTRIGVQWLNLTLEQLGRGSAYGKTIAAIMRGLGWELKQVRIPGSSLRTKAFVLSLQSQAQGGSSSGDDGSHASAENRSDMNGRSDNRIDDEDMPF